VDQGGLASEIAATAAAAGLTSKSVDVDALARTTRMFVSAGQVDGQHALGAGPWTAGTFGADRGPTQGLQRAKENPPDDEAVNAAGQGGRLAAAAQMPKEQHNHTGAPPERVLEGGHATAQRVGAHRGRDTSQTAALVLRGPRFDPHPDGQDQGFDNNSSSSSKNRRNRSSSSKERKGANTWLSRAEARHDSAGLDGSNAKPLDYRDTKRHSLQQQTTNTKPTHSRGFQVGSIPLRQLPPLQVQAGWEQPQGPYGRLYYANNRYREKRTTTTKHGRRLGTMQMDNRGRSRRDSISSAPEMSTINYLAP
jgi:hypothetical protein